MKSRKGDFNMKSSLKIIVPLMLVTGMILAACQPKTEVKETATTEIVTTSPAANEQVVEVLKYAGQDLLLLTGTIYAAGSSTVYPLAEAIAENFKADGFSGEIKIDSIGSGAGFERFCKTGETDISTASRAIKDSEKTNCATIDRSPIEFRVGTDAVAIVVSSANTFVTNVTLEELAKIFTTATNWSDVRPDWPNEPIQRFTPGTDSGTFDFFVETIIQKPQGLATLDEGKAIALAATNLQASEDDNVLVLGVEGSPFAIGYFGFAYYTNNANELEALSINGIAPDFTTAEDGTYKLSRPLFIYSDANILKSKPQVAAFVDYFLKNVDSVIGNVGYFPASDVALAASEQALTDALK
jgi:phosphate transport system substrate-binding protein